MWRSSRAPGGADPLRRSLEHPSARDLIGIAGESLHKNVRVLLQLTAFEQRVLLFSLEVAVGFIACAGAILAMFAWSGAGL